MQRHPVAQTVTHVDFQIVRRDEVIAADVPIVLVGEALEVHHGDGLVDQQMFTLAIKARPADIPTSLEVDISGLTIGAQLRISDLTCRPASPPSRPRDGHRHRAAAACRHAGGRRRGRGGREGERGRRGRRRAAEAHPATRAKPCAASSPGPSDGARRPTCWWSGWAIRGASSPGRCTTRGRRGRAAGQRRARRCGPRRASRPAWRSSRSGRRRWRWPSRPPT
jgi:hypothetical protein